MNMAKFYDISDWAEKPYINTKGTRNKCIVIEPNSGIEYYFKTSIARWIRRIDSSLPNASVISKIPGPFPSPTNARRAAFMIFPK